MMGFGAGALIGGIAYELLPESLLKEADWWILAGFAAERWQPAAVEG